MSQLHIFLGNKNYSSWSFRPWIAMRATGIAFTETVVPFSENPEGNAEKFHEFSPSMLVPVLKDGDLSIWETLAILEYLAEKFPESGLWPDDSKHRAHARALASEMHAGFTSLRGACPMNMRRPPAHLEVDAGVMKDVARIEEIWAQCLDVYGGPFLFGQFSNADAMYAPVVNRLAIYKLSSHDAVSAYSQAMTTLPAWQEWEQAGREEPWVVPYDEI